MPAQVLDHVRRDREPLAVEELGVALREVVDQRRDLFGPLAQGRYHDLEDVQPVVEVLSELAGRHGLLQVLVGGRDDSDVHLDRGVAPDPRELPVLQDVEELGLERRVEIADLVEEDGAVVGRLELADLELMGAGEGPALVAEQLRLQQLARDRRAVDLHEGPPVARGMVVDRPGDEVLARAGFAADQHRDVHLGGLLDDPPDLLHPGAAPEGGLLPKPPGCVVGRSPWRCRDDRRAYRLDGVLQLVGLRGLDDEVVRSEGGGFADPIAVLGVEEHDEGAWIGAQELDLTQQVHPVGAVQLHAYQAELESPSREKSKRLVRRPCRKRVVAPAPEQSGEMAPESLICFHNEHGFIVHDVSWWPVAAGY